MNRNPSLVGQLGALSLLVALGGCGGGGSASESAEAPPPVAGGLAPPAPAPAPAPPGAGTPAGTRATCHLAGFQADMLALVNQHRLAGATCGSRGTFPPAGALRWNDALSQASLVHSDDMVALDFFSHTGSNGSSAGQRITAAGYVWQTWGENIAAGQPDVPAVVSAWMNSPGHCANLMNASFRDLGAACVLGSAGNRYRTYWTQNLGAAR